MLKIDSEWRYILAREELAHRIRIGKLRAKETGEEYFAARQHPIIQMEDSKRSNIALNLR
jgi:hypothetical protein